MVVWCPTEQARAKLNLDLLVTGRTPAGYHELDSIVVFADIGDRLALAPAEAVSLTVQGPFADALRGERDNLVLRAIRLLGEAVGHPLPVAVTLEKNLPVASGIGGGSADAAAVLRGLVRLFDLDLGEAALHQVALGLGADVPVCIAARPARMQGIGERLDPVLGLPDLPVVLLNPGVSVSTSAVFKALEWPIAAFRRPPRPSGASPMQVASWLKASRNDLEQAALCLAPEIAGALAALNEAPGCLLARMSGSGATCFGLFPDEWRAHAAATRIAAAEPRWWCRACIAPGASA